MQVAVHTDEDDAAALFLYRKLIREPIEAPVLMPGPAVEATDAEMQVRPRTSTKCAASARARPCTPFVGLQDQRSVSCLQKRSLMYTVGLRLLAHP